MWWNSTTRRDVGSRISHIGCRKSDPGSGTAIIRVMSKSTATKGTERIFGRGGNKKDSVCRISDLERYIRTIFFWIHTAGISLTGFYQLLTQLSGSLLWLVLLQQLYTNCCVFQRSSSSTGARFLALQALYVGWVLSGRK